MENIVAKVRPILRGHFHQAAFFIGLGACSVLVAVATSPISRLSALIYTICLLSLFGISSLYHRIYWPLHLLRWIRKLDHAAIYIFIAGTFTPVCLLGLGGESGQKLLNIVWGFSILGILKEFFWKNSQHWVSGLMYVIMGWLATPFIGEFYEKLGPRNTALLISGGLIYTIGAVIYALKKPNPFPKYFGYHEIFHVLVIIAGFLHFCVIYQLVIS